MTEFQLRLISSTNALPFHLTISPVDGGLGVEAGGMGGSPPWPGTALSLTDVVWLPDSNTAAYTVDPSAVLASARGVSPNSWMLAIGVPPMPVPRLVASKT